MVSDHLLVNLFDYNFIQAECSVAFQQPEHIIYSRNNYNWDGITIFTDAYIIDGTSDKVNSRYKIGWLHEPQCLHPDIYEQAFGLQDKFDFILTYYEPYLVFPKFRFCPYGGIWINKKDWGVGEKSLPISMLISNKKSTTGHLIRHCIYDLHFDYPYIDWYGCYGTPTDYSAETKSKVLKPYFYSIVTETCNEMNLFTEILLDCFAVGTVPVFWGAPNIGDYFDINGIITFDEARDISRILPTLTWSRYNKMLPAINNNFVQAMQYAVTEDWIYHNVLRTKELLCLY